MDRMSQLMSRVSATTQQRDPSSVPVVSGGSLSAMPEQSFRALRAATKAQLPTIRAMQSQPMRRDISALRSGTNGEDGEEDDDSLKMEYDLASEFDKDTSSPFSPPNDVTDADLIASLDPKTDFVSEDPAMDGTDGFGDANRDGTDAGVWHHIKQAAKSVANKAKAGVAGYKAAKKAAKEDYAKRNEEQKLEEKERQSAKDEKKREKAEKERQKEEKKKKKDSARDKSSGYEGMSDDVTYMLSDQYVSSRDGTDGHGGHGSMGTHMASSRSMTMGRDDPATLLRAQRARDLLQRVADSKAMSPSSRSSTMGDGGEMDPAREERMNRARELLQMVNSNRTSTEGSHMRSGTMGGGGGMEDPRHHHHHHASRAERIKAIAPRSSTQGGGDREKNVAYMLSDQYGEKKGRSHTAGSDQIAERLRASNARLSVTRTRTSPDPDDEETRMMAYDSGKKSMTASTSSTDLKALRTVPDIVALGGPAAFNELITKIARPDMKHMHMVGNVWSDVGTQIMHVMASEERTKATLKKMIISSRTVRVDPGAFSSTVPSNVSSYTMNTSIVNNAKVVSVVYNFKKPVDPVDVAKGIKWNLHAIPNVSVKLSTHAVGMSENGVVGTILMERQHPVFVAMEYDAARGGFVRAVEIAMLSQ